MARLINIADKSIEVKLPEKEHITIGRDRETDIQIIREEISRQHTVISFDGGNYWVKDANSMNGTYLTSVGLRPQQEVILTDGVIIGFGTPEKERGYEFREK